MPAAVSKPEIKTTSLSTFAFPFMGPFIGLPNYLFSLLDKRFLDYVVYLGPDKVEVQARELTEKITMLYMFMIN